MYKIIGANDQYQARGAENCVAISSDHDWTIEAFKNMIWEAAENNAIFDDGANDVIVVLFPGKSHQETCSAPALYRSLKPFFLKEATATASA